MKPLKAIAWITALVLWGSFVACHWCEAQDIRGLPGKRSQPGIDRYHRIQPPIVMDVSGNYINVDFNWQKARDPFKRLK